MIAINRFTEAADASWQDSFIQLLPEIQARLQRTFRHFDEEARETSTHDGIVTCMLAYVKLHGRGRAQAVTPSNLVWFAAIQVKHGRPAGYRMNGREPLSRYAQLRRGIRVETLEPYHSTDDEWVNAMVEDKRSSVADQAIARIDIHAWLSSLPRRSRQIAKDLAHGCSTREVAQKFGVTAGRISQLRRELQRSWAAFQHEDLTA
jgi:hypothetical protein